jgi:hypothetical protein
LNDGRLSAVGGIFFAPRFKKKKPTRQSFFNFQENLNEGMNTFQILTSKFRFDLMHWKVSIGPEKWPIFGRFQTLFPLKHPARREKIPPTWRDHR